ncbi:MAG: lipoyl(octanoyl) transferase LipB [Solirubrobacteraceae bacterium]|nr:lipoyl(octanoyl) transferase LipB [Patulibacter sp.]
MADLLVCHLGLVPYEEALALQLALREARVAGAIDDVLLLLEHPPVVTRGRRSDPSELGLGEAFLRSQGVDVITTQRGGLATYHGPGMLVGYPIVAAADVHAYLRTLERAVVGALAEEGVDAHQRESTPEENLTGVWVGGPEELGVGGSAPLRTDGAPVPHAGQHRKIASIGVHMSRGVAAHGFAIGADNDLTPWDWFTPCGLPTARMTSVGAETGRSSTLPCLRKRAANHVARELGLRQRLVSRHRLEAVAADFADRIPQAGPVTTGRPAVA